MKITKIEAIPIDIPFTLLFVTHLGRVGSKSVIVKIHTDEGITGIGEARGRVESLGESVADIALIIEKHLGPNLIGEDVFELERIIHKMDLILEDRNVAKASIDFALYDIIGKALNMPIYKLLGGKVRKKIPVDHAIGFKSPNEMAKEALHYIKKFGIKDIKIKVGSGDTEQDINNVATVREAVGDRIKIKVDCNQGYNRATAIRTLRKMEKYDLELIEQPLPKWDLDGMAMICNALDTPIMADESVFSPENSIRVIKREAADIINIKTLRVGGIHKAKMIDKICQAAGIPSFGGGFTETSVGTAANAHFQVSSASMGFAGELHVGLIGWYRDDDVVKHPLEVKDGYLEPPRGPGIGVELDEDKIAKHAIKGF